MKVSVTMKKLFLLLTPGTRQSFNHPLELVLFAFLGSPYPCLLL